MGRMKAEEMLVEFYIPTLEKKMKTYESLQDSVKKAMLAGKPGVVFHTKGYGEGAVKRLGQIPEGLTYQMLRMFQEDGFCAEIRGDNHRLVIEWAK